MVDAAFGLVHNSDAVGAAMTMRDRLLLSLVVAASSSPIAVNGRAGEV